MTPFIYIDPRATKALAQITDSGLNVIRCSLTGAPYATIRDEEIILALEGDIESDDAVTLDRLVDNWQLRLLAMSSTPSPMLRGVREGALIPLLKRGHAGNVRVLTYLLTRLFYPHIGTNPMPSIVAQERMGFAAEAFDLYSKVEESKVANLSQQLIAIDSYCAMPYWHKLWIFESKLSAYGIDRVGGVVRKSFRDPSIVLADSNALPAVVKFLFDMMLYASDNDSTMGRGGNKLSQQLLTIDGRGPIDGIPQHQKTLSQADIDRMARAKAINAKQELRIAWSATHGKGHLSTETMAERLAKKATTSVTAKPAAKKAKPAKPMSALDSQVANVFSKLLAAMPADMFGSVEKKKG